MKNRNKNWGEIRCKRRHRKPRPKCVEKYWNKKIEAWSCYEGESKEFPFPRSNEGLKILSGYRGLSSGLKLSEAFRLERMIVKN